MMFKNLLRKIDNYLFGYLKAQYVRMLEKEVDGCESLLDVGCGARSSIQFLKTPLKYTVGVDGFEPSIQKSMAASIHSEYFLMNIKEIGEKFQPNSFDCVYISDVIEHLSKVEGIKLIEVMEKIAIKKVIIFTPNGFLPQHEYDGNTFQVHLSGYEVDELRSLGYRVTGVNGWKVLRGEFAWIKWWPRVFWGRVSLISQCVTEYKPYFAFAIFCVKDLDHF